MSTTSATAAIPGSDTGAPAAKPRTTTSDGKTRTAALVAHRGAAAGAGWRLSAACHYQRRLDVFIIVTQSNSDWVSHTLQVEYKLSNLRVLIRAAESSERGYLLTGSPDYLSEFQSLAAKSCPHSRGSKKRRPIIRCNSKRWPSLAL